MLVDMDTMTAVQSDACPMGIPRAGVGRFAVVPLHRPVPSGLVWRAVFRADVRLARVVRLFAAEGLGRWRVGRWYCVDEVQTVASELFANAVVHGSTADGNVLVVLRKSYRRLRIEVHDSSPVLPVAAVAGEDWESGRGLLMVGELADSWGSVRTAKGKCVFARFRARGWSR